MGLLPCSSLTTSYKRGNWHSLHVMHEGPETQRSNEAARSGLRLVVALRIIFPLPWIVDSTVSGLPNLPWETQTGEGKEVHYLLSTVLGIFHVRKGTYFDSGHFSDDGRW